MSLSVDEVANDTSGYKKFTDFASLDDITFRPPPYTSDVGHVVGGGAETEMQQNQPQRQQQIVIIQAPKMQRSFAKYSGNWASVCGMTQASVINNVH